MNCRICKKPLKNFQSVKLGLGPVCRLSEAMQGNLFSDTHAEFTVLSECEDYILIKDSNSGKSVTNDAEYVVNTLAHGNGNKKIFYIDSMGILDEISHKNGEFKNFLPGSLNGAFLKPKYEGNSHDNLY